MLLSNRKLRIIEEMFTMPYRPVLSHYKSDKLDMSEINNKISTNHFLSSSLNKKNLINNKSLELTKSQKSSFPSYEFNSDMISNINYSIDDLSYTLYYPLKKDIIIENPEEVIQSNYIQGSVKQKLAVSQINDENNNEETQKPQKEPINIYNCLNDNFEEKFEKENNLNVPNIVQSIAPNNNNIVIEDENRDNINVASFIPGKSTETMNLIDNIKPTTSIEETPEIMNEQEKAEKENNEKQIEETPVIQDKKYKIPSSNNGVVTLPANYSTDDEDEFNALKVLNEDLSSWEKFTDKEGLKLYFKPLPVKDEKGNDGETIIGFLDGILDFPASLVTSKLNDYNFRINIEDTYKKGKLLKEKMEGNLKIMEMYLYMKMPFIFSDRDFVVQKKCWLDYNGNRDHALFHMHSIENPEYPAKEKPVRANYIYRTGYVKPLGDAQCELTTVTAMDVKISLGYSAMAKSGAKMQEKWFNDLKKELAK